MHAWLLDAAGLLAEPDPGPTRWLIDGLIVDAAIVACVGRWKTLKSYALLYLCILVATGEPAFGTLEIEQPGPVLFVNEESGRAAGRRKRPRACFELQPDPAVCYGWAGGVRVHKSCLTMYRRMIGAFPGAAQGRL